MEFVEFNKIARLNRNCIITEKIDGTNAQIYIERFEEDDILISNEYALEKIYSPIGIFVLYAGSRTRWITPNNDNHGFAKWVKENAEELSKLGVGRHFGEWWGQGIQRNYNQKEKHFSLFNITRYRSIDIPECCSIVPVLYEGLFSTDAVNKSLDFLRKNGSAVSSGFMKPEGIVIYHEAANTLFKVTLEKDEIPKGHLTK